MRTLTSFLLSGMTVLFPALAQATTPLLQRQHLLVHAAAGAIETRPTGTSVSTVIEGMGPVIDLQSLEQQRGGESTVANEVGIDGTLSGNVAENTFSGSNLVTDGAFDNAAGINTVIQNSGNNVLIQNGMVVNIQFVAPVP